MLPTGGINDGRSIREMKWKWIAEFVDTRQAVEHYSNPMNTNKTNNACEENTEVSAAALYLLQVKCVAPNTASSDKIVSDCV